MRPLDLESAVLSALACGWLALSACTPDESANTAGAGGSTVGGGGSTSHAGGSPKPGGGGAGGGSERPDIYADDDPGERGLRLPKDIDLVAGEPFSLYWAGLGFHRSSETARFSYGVTGPGLADATHWEWMPSEADAGTSQVLVITVSQGDSPVGRATTRLKVKSRASNAPKLRINLTGDSITAADLDDAFSNITMRLLLARGLDASSYGSLMTTNADPGVRTEGHPGRTYAFFNGDNVDANDPSPYAAGGPAYVDQFGRGAPFTDIVDALGVNDISGCRVDHPEDFAAVVASAEGLIAKQLEGSPGARIWVAPPFNPSIEDDDLANPGTVEAAAYEAKRLILISYLYDAFRDREAAGIRLLATHAALEPFGDFDENFVHPNALGHPRLGRIIAGGVAPER